MKPSTWLALPILAASVFSTAANADTISNAYAFSGSNSGSVADTALSYKIGNTLYGNTEIGVGGFDSALGTLNSVSISFTNTLSAYTHGYADTIAGSTIHLKTTSGVSDLGLAIDGASYGIIGAAGTTASCSSSSGIIPNCYANADSGDGTYTTNINIGITSSNLGFFTNSWAAGYSNVFSGANSADATNILGTFPAADNQITGDGSNWSGKMVVTYNYTAPPSTVPLPASAWLLGSGILGLIGIARKKARA